MKAESNIMPQHPFVLDRRDDLADITFFANAREKEVEEGSIWEYDTYTLSVPHRHDLEITILENLESWLQRAREAEIPMERETTEREQLENYVLELDMRMIMLEFGL